MSTELNIPEFLKRDETPEQAEARRKKNAPKNESKGLKVVTPLDTKISAAIAKDFADKGTKAQKAADAVIATTTAKPPKKIFPTDHGDEAIPRNAKPPKAKPAKAKKVSPVIAKALRERDALNAKVAEAKSAKPAVTAKKPAAKSKPKREPSGKYDWDKAAALAKSGKLPPLPPFNSYKPHIKKFYDLAVKKDKAGIKKLSAEYVDEKGARANMFRFRDLLLVALK